MLCKCGCGKEIISQPYHKYYGIPLFISGHNSKTKEGKEFLSNMAQAKTGNKNSFYGKHHSKKTKKLIGSYHKDKIISEEHLEKLRIRFSGKGNPMYGVHLTGAKCGGWKGGITPLMEKIRTCNKYLEWREKVFKRDKYTCKDCGDKKGGNLQAHHIKLLSFLVEKYKIKTLKQARDFKELWDVKNGITFCKKCHKRLHSELSLTTLKCLGI